MLAALAVRLTAADPYLAFSDLDSGPRTGNSDISHGGTAARDGAYVSVWGLGLGADKGGSRIFCGGAEAAAVLYWGPATPPWSPSDLAAKHHAQLIVFQISHLAADGAGSITVEVAGRVSNALPFTVRGGTIRFVSVTGDDTTGDGTWARPLRTIQTGVDAAVPGDITYLDGVAQTTPAGDRAAVNLGARGSPGRPIALVGYPGSVASVGTPDLDGFSSWISGVGEARGWTVAKIRITALSDAIGMSDDFRVVGNHIEAPKGDGPTGAISGFHDRLRVLGNELTHVGAPRCSKLYHPIYLQGERASSGPRLPTETDREVAWNYLHDNNAPDGINLYSEDTACAFTTGHRIHHNVIINQVGGGILIGYYVCGETWVYDNVIIRAGLGPEPVGDPSNHFGMTIDAGHEAFAGSVVHVHANTLYGCGFTGAAYGPGASGMLEFGTRNARVDFVDNIVVSTGEPYQTDWSDPVPSQAGHNVWFGAGAGPAWDTARIESNPQLTAPADGDVALGPGSAAIDAGVPLTAADEAIDLFATPRPQGAGWDIGAVEYEASSTGGTTTGGSTTAGTTTGGLPTAGSTTAGTTSAGATTGSTGKGGCGRGGAVAVLGLGLAMLAPRRARR